MESPIKSDVVIAKEAAALRSRSIPRSGASRSERSEGSPPAIVTALKALALTN